jgi:hypothetical protein
MFREKYRIRPLFSLEPDRPFLLDLALGSTAFFLWLLLGCIEVRVASSRELMDLAIIAPQWQFRWPLGPWLVGTGGLFLAFLRHRLSALRGDGSPQIQSRLQRASLFTFILLLVRLATFWHPVTHYFPYLTILWAPHSLWALSLLFSLFLHFPFDGSPEQLRQWRVSSRSLAILLFLTSLSVYGLYTLFYCQVTMLHGDEGQYLRVTQSLLHDGDMDLANNLSIDQIKEFHVRNIGVHQIPVSPPGKIHSIHPIGLSTALLPAYWFGLKLWSNPRLSTALFMALLAAGSLSLSFLWLIRLGIGQATALLAAIIMGITAPFFLYSNQLYPEIPALLITFSLLTLLAHWQVPGGTYRSLGPAEPLWLTLAAVLLICLPFLHWRFIPLGLLLGALISLQAWHSTYRRISLLGVCVVSLLGFCCLLFFNLALTDDWMGPFRPGNVYAAQEAISFSTWFTSLPGHWLHIGMGILNISPIFLLCWIGWSRLVLQRDRRLFSILCIYGTTAVISGLHPNWTLGSCFPARFLIAALPALLYGLAMALPVVFRHCASLFIAGVAFAISAESVAQAVWLPETGFMGVNLLVRTINHFYPISIHFLPIAQKGFPFFYFSFWASLTLLFWITVARKPTWGWARFSSIFLAAILPFLFSRAETVVDRLPGITSPYSPPFSWGRPISSPTIQEFPANQRRRETGEKQSDGRFVAREPGHSCGLICSTHLPLCTPGFYTMNVPDIKFRASIDQISGHMIFLQRYTVRTVSPWGKRISLPFIGGELETPGLISLSSRIERPIMGDLLMEFSGTGELSFRDNLIRFLPTERTFNSEEERRFKISNAGWNEDHSELQESHHLILPPGFYQARFALSGSTFSTFFERLPTPIFTAIYTAPIEPENWSPRLETLTRLWFNLDRKDFTTLNSRLFFRPQVESVQPPWWLSIPFVGSTFFELDFALSEPRDVWFLCRYSGPKELSLDEIILYRYREEDYARFKDERLWIK